MNWPRIYAVFATGVTAAFLIGKAPAALPVLRDEFDLTIFETGLIVATFSLIAAIAGLLFGGLSDRFGQRRLAVTGLIVAAVGGAAGGLANSPESLIGSRICEGLGFFMMSVSLPSMIIRLADANNRQSAMGLWGAYLPLGAGLVLLCGGALIAQIGWRGLWFVIALAGMFMLWPLLWAAPTEPSQKAGQLAFRDRIRAVLASRGALALAVTFGCYSGQYIALTSFVPLILVERIGWPLPLATMFGAAVMLANVIGNVAAGLLLDRGWTRAILVAVASVAMAVGATLVMSDGLPLSVRLAGAILFSSLGGLIPGALFAGVARHAPSPDHISSVNGLMLQCVAIGQLFGPVAMTFAVQRGGGDWSWALIYLLPMAVLTVVGAGAISRLERTATSDAAKP
jgi:MFS family permease